MHLHHPPRAGHPTHLARGASGAITLLLAALAAACAGPSAPVSPTARAPLPAPGAPAAPAPAPDPFARYGPEPDFHASPLEQEALAAARAALATGGKAPHVSGALSLAARTLARRSAAGEPGLAEGPALRAALAVGLSYDPAPVQFRYVGDPAGVAAALSRALPRDGAATHLGVGAALVGGAVHLVVLTSQRHARLEPFPRDVAPGQAAPLAGGLSPGLRAPRVFVTDAAGAVAEIPAAASGAGFRATVRFTRAGPHLVEVTAQGAEGPAVVALLAVRAGGGPLGGPELNPTGPAARGTPEEQVLAALNALRGQRGLAPLARTAALDAVARAHSEAMRRAGRIGHAVPGSPAPGERVEAARIPYRTVRENVARAPTALSAHAAAVESPAHLENILDPDIRQAGLGVVREGDTTYLTELFVAPPASDDGPLTLDARVRAALWRARAQRGLPALTSDPFLEAIAREGAAALRDADASPSARPDLAGQALARRRLAADDLFVASAPEEATRSTHVADPRYLRVGVGVVQGTSRRYGPGRLFIAVVYSD